MLAVGLSLLLFGGAIVSTQGSKTSGSLSAQAHGMESAVEATLILAMLGPVQGPDEDLVARHRLELQYGQLALLRRYTLGGEGLGGISEEEAAAVEAESLVSQEAEVGACTNWSGYYWDGSSMSCGVRFSCGTNCDEFGNCEVNPAAYREEYSYRTCFDPYGNYTHTEYQYRRGAFMYCGC